MKNIQYNLLLAFFISAIMKVSAQEILPIDLQSVLEMGGASNLTIKEFHSRQELANASYSKTREWWLPEVYAGLETHRLWGAVMNGNGSFFLDVSRNSLWTGVGLNANWNFADAVYKTKAAKLQVLASASQTRAEKNKALLAMVKVFYDLQTAQLKLIAYQRLVSQADTITQQIAVQVDAGLRYQSELLLSRSNQNHLKIEMLNAQSEFNRTSAELVRLLNLDSKVKLVSVDSLLVPLDFQDELLSVNDTIYQNHPEMKVIDFSLRSIREEKKTTTTGLFIPQLSIGAFSSYFGRLNGPVTPMAPDQYPNTKQLYPTGAFNGSLQWKIPVGRLLYGSDLKKYNSLIKIQETRSEQIKAQINEEIRNAQQQLVISKDQVSIATDALKLTAEALKQSVERQKLGTAKPFEVFQAQQFYMQAQIDYLKAVALSNKAQFEMKVAKGEQL
ncbi:MAG: TolC family protein [Bacteroidota bacterium]